MRTQALLKIEAAARKAALASNSKLREADDALAESQKALGTNAVHLHLLTGASTGRGEAVFQCSALARGANVVVCASPEGQGPGGEIQNDVPHTAQGIHVREHCSYVTHSCYHPCTPTSCTHTKVQS